MSTISVYTTTYNAIEQEYCAIEGIKSALCFADEVIVVDSCSTDGTVEAIKKINDPRIKIYSIDWLPNIGWAMYKIAKSMAIGRCTKDWCLLMDSDEVFHEKDYDLIKMLSGYESESVMGIKFNTLHFYGDYNHLLNGYSGWKDLYVNKVYMVRNGMGIHHGNSGMDIDAHLDRYGIPLNKECIIYAGVDVFHYGHVRSNEAYVKKQLRMHSFYTGEKVDTLKPDNVVINSLEIFQGTHPKTMKYKVENK
jgi:glycosyltransferase involved in cell wall biosynthesis